MATQTYHSALRMQFSVATAFHNNIIKRDGCLKQRFMNKAFPKTLFLMLSGSIVIVVDLLMERQTKIPVTPD